MEQNGQNDRITYSESRTINIGDYENINCFLSFGVDVKKINYRDSVVKTSHSETEVLNESSEESFNEAAVKVVKRVKAVLDAREVTIRKASAPYNGVEHDTLAKMPIQKKSK